jgi:hypothetical protein
MTSAPLAMKMCGLSLSDSNFGIQWHVVAMYGPSFITGSLIARFGAPIMVALGLALEGVAATIGLSGIATLHFWATLMVLGLGWNFAFVGASALVLETHAPQEKNKVQALNDFLIFGTMAVGSFSSAGRRSISWSTRRCFSALSRSRSCPLPNAARGWTRSTNFPSRASKPLLMPTPDTSIQIEAITLAAR